MALWIESRTTLRHEKRIFALCHDLKVTHLEAIGLVHCLWWWTLQNRECGDLSALLDSDIALACGWHGNKKRLIMALHDVGFLDKYKVVGWEYIGLRPCLLRHANNNNRSKYRARLKKATISHVNRLSIIQRDKSICYICFKKLKQREITLDHIKPLAKGGSHCEENLKVACRPCNSRKWAH